MVGSFQLEQLDKDQVDHRDQEEDQQDDDCSKCSKCVRRIKQRRWRPEIFRETKLDPSSALSAIEKCRSSYYGVFGARIAIMLMLAILIGLITILTWHFTTAYATKSIKSLAYSLRVELLKRTITRSWNLVSTTLDATTTLANLSDYMIPRHHRSAAENNTHHQHLVMRNITWAVFSSRQSLKTLSILYKNGQVQAFDRNPITNKTYYMFSNDSSSAELTITWDTQLLQTDGLSNWYRQELNPATGQPVDPAVSIPSMNITRYTGDVSGLKSGETFWHVAVGSTDNECLLSSASDVRNLETNDLIATVVVTSALSSISKMMRDLARNYSGSFYLTSVDGLLLASSSNHSLVRVLSHGPKLTPAVDSQDSIIRDGARWLQEYHRDSILAQQEVHAEDIVLGGERFYVDSFYWNLTGLPLIGVILLPRSYVLGDVDSRGHTTLIILVSVAVSILIVGCLLILFFTSGVSTEMRLRSELIKHLHARQRAEASSNYKSQFLANMSHELRTPMAAVIGLLDILLTDSCLSIEQTAIVSQIRHCSTALLRLLNNILDLSKVESGKLVLEKVDFNIRHELEAVVDMFSVQCVDIDIVLDIADNIPTMVRGDLTRTVQIFANLIGNSIKFTASTHGHIVVRGWAEAISSRYQPGGHIEKFLLWFEVDDTGSGIDPSKWETVFDSFVQADSSTSRTHGGTGLGLCIVRSLVSKMGGEIKVVKKDEPGTVMRFYLMYDSSLEISTPDHTIHLAQSTLFPCDINQFKVFIGMKGAKLRSSLVDWITREGVEASSTEDWNSFIAHLDRELLDQENKSSKQKLLAILDTRLLPQNLEALTDQIDVLNTFTKRGALVSWVLNHDTPATVKTRIRDKGYTIMANKPLYRSKVFTLLKSLVGTLPDSFCFIPGLQWKDGILGLRNATVDYAQDTIWYGNEPPRALDKLSKRMDYILSEVASHVAQKTRYGNDIDDDSFSQSGGGGGGSARFKVTNPPKANANGGELKAAEKPEVAAKSDQTVPSSTTTTTTIVAPGASLTGIHILLAEDTPVIQKVAVVLLKKLGATVVAVADGQAAVDAWKESLEIQLEPSSKKKPFDLILMDCQMPRMDGYDATREIRRAEEGSSCHVPIVALTAHAMSSDEERCLEVGMDAYLTKPIDCKLMATTILSLTKRKIVWH